MTLNQKLAAFFKEHPGEWLDGRVLSQVAGAYAWRSRCADIRRIYSMDIQNRQRRLRNDAGKGYVVSEYRYEPPAEAVVLSVASNGQCSFI